MPHKGVFDLYSATNDTGGPYVETRGDEWRFIANTETRTSIGLFPQAVQTFIAAVEVKW